MYVEACCFQAFFYIIIVYIWFVLEGCCICTGIYCCITCIHMHWYECMCGDCILIVLYRVLYCIVSVLYTIFLCAQCGHAQCSRRCTLQTMWTGSVWSLSGDVNTAWECDTPTVPVSVECHLSVACASEASTRSCFSRCRNAAGAFCTSFPTLKGKGGHGHLSCLFSQHTAQGGQAGPVPSPLNSPEPLLSP